MKLCPNNFDELSTKAKKEVLNNLWEFFLDKGEDLSTENICEITGSPRDLASVSVIAHLGFPAWDSTDGFNKSGEAWLADLATATNVRSEVNSALNNLANITTVDDEVLAGETVENENLIEAIRLFSVRLEKDKQDFEFQCEVGTFPDKNVDGLTRLDRIRGIGQVLKKLLAGSTDEDEAKDRFRKLLRFRRLIFNFRRMSPLAIDKIDSAFQEKAQTAEGYLKASEALTRVSKVMLYELGGVDLLDTANDEQIMNKARELMPLENDLKVAIDATALRNDFSFFLQ